MTMNYLLGTLNLRAFRYCVLVTFLICNGLNASFAVWNLGLVHDGGLHKPMLVNVDSYVTFLGASGLVVSFTVAFVELVHITSFVATVWFECVWVALWELMYLAASIILTVITAREGCTNTGPVPECVSIQVLLAFTWFCAITLTIYFSTLMFAIFINKKKDSTIWHSLMRKFPWAGTCTILASAPPTPTIPQFQENTVPIIRAPKPKHARPNGSAGRPPIFSWRSGLSHEYGIEHYRPQTNAQNDGPIRSPGNQPGPSGIVDLPPAAALPVIPGPHLPPIDMGTLDNTFASSLYPMYMQPVLFQPNREPTHASPTNTAKHVQTARGPVLSNLPPSPPPLGNWPRPDVMSRPVDKGKRKAPPIIPRGDFSSSQGSLGSSVNVKQREQEMRQSNAPSSFSPLRPMGPRSRSGSSDLSDLPSQPPRLELPKIEYA